MEKTLQDLRDLARRHGPLEPGATLPRFMLKADRAPTGPMPAMYEPMVCFVLQGAKRVTSGGRTQEHAAPSMVAVSADLPIVGEVSLASADEPYLAAALAVDPARVSELLIDAPEADRAAPYGGLDVAPMTPEAADALLRLMRLLDSPRDIPVLAPLAERELLYRLLSGPSGEMLRQIGRPDSRLSQVRRAIARIREDFSATMRVDELAEVAGMSASSFHRHFKAVTAMSPLQYQKQIRLQEARRRLMARPGAVASVAYSVGYESASQFSREYARQFGQPPARDLAAMRDAATA